MKKVLLFAALIFSGLLPFSSFANPVHDTVAMGPGYGNDVFYSLSGGVVKSEPRNNWDIAFYTNRWSAGIMINDGAGHMLYTYPNGDTSSWNNIDSTGISEWINLYNSDTIWEDGAFNRNSLGHPDYGWGVYNMINHDVVGDSLYIVKLANGSLKKLWIKRKNSITNTFHFKYANLNGSQEVNETLNVTPYQSNRMFIYYSLVNQAIVDREPDIASWDLLWSRYAAIVYDLSGNASYYIVVGVTNNLEVEASKHHPVGPDFDSWYTKPFETHKTPIGHNWKEFNMTQFQWLITDSLTYFVKNRQGDIYKLQFDYFSGSGAGKTGLVKKLLSLVSVNEQPSTNAFSVFPNPATSLITIELPENENNAEIRIFDQAGRLVLSETTTTKAQNYQVNLENLRNGLYIIEVKNGNATNRQKLIVKH
jgi:hypothetical protein